MFRKGHPRSTNTNTNTNTTAKGKQRKIPPEVQQDLQVAGQILEPMPPPEIHLKEKDFFLQI